MHIDRFDGVFGGWYAVVNGQETKVHFTKLGAFLAGLLLWVRP